MCTYVHVFVYRYTFTCVCEEDPIQSMEGYSKVLGILNKGGNEIQYFKTSEKEGWLNSNSKGSRP